MKKTLATFCLICATLALPACSSTTAGHSKGMSSSSNKVVPADKVFSRAQAK